jgi:hypothetical protein
VGRCYIRRNGPTLAAPSEDVARRCAPLPRLRHLLLADGPDRCVTQEGDEAKFGIPVIYTSTVQDLATERAASWLSKHFTYWWLEQQGHGRVFIDTDGL